jgi:hypothetical protein
LAEVPFFGHDRYRTLLDEGDRVLTVPAAGRNMYWQVEADLSFAMAAGYVGATPKSFTRYRAWRLLAAAPFARPGPGSSAQLRRFVADKGVTVLLAESSLGAPWLRLFDSLGRQPTESGGVLVYRLAPPR